METMDFFSTSPHMRGLRGDTFPPFYILVDDMDPTECEMRLVLEDQSIPGGAVLIKSCDHFTATSGDKGFRVQLDSDETALLCGVYNAHFILTDDNDLEYRKLVGVIEVVATPGEVS